MHYYLSAGIEALLLETFTKHIRNNLNFPRLMFAVSRQQVFVLGVGLLEVWKTDWKMSEGDQRRRLENEKESLGGEDDLLWSLRTLESGLEKVICMIFGVEGIREHGEMRRYDEN